MNSIRDNWSVWRALEIDEAPSPRQARILLVTSGARFGVRQTHRKTWVVTIDCTNVKIDEKKTPKPYEYPTFYAFYKARKYARNSHFRGVARTHKTTLPVTPSLKVRSPCVYADYTTTEEERDYLVNLMREKVHSSKMKSAPHGEKVLGQAIGDFCFPRAILDLCKSQNWYTSSWAEERILSFNTALNWTKMNSIALCTKLMMHLNLKDAIRIDSGHATAIPGTKVLLNMTLVEHAIRQCTSEIGGDRVVGSAPNGRKYDVCEIKETLVSDIMFYPCSDKITVVSEQTNIGSASFRIGDGYVHRPVSFSFVTLKTFCNLIRCEKDRQSIVVTVDSEECVVGNTLESKNLSLPAHSGKWASFAIHKTYRGDNGILIALLICSDTTKDQVFSLLKELRIPVCGWATDNESDKYKIYDTQVNRSSGNLASIADIAPFIGLEKIKWNSTYQCTQRFYLYDYEMLYYTLVDHLVPLALLKDFTSSRSIPLLVQDEACYDFYVNKKTLALESISDVIYDLVFKHKGEKLVYDHTWINSIMQGFKVTGVKRYEPGYVLPRQSPESLENSQAVNLSTKHLSHMILSDTESKDNMNQDPFAKEVSKIDLNNLILGSKGGKDRAKGSEGGRDSKSIARKAANAKARKDKKEIRAEFHSHVIQSRMEMEQSMREVDHKAALAARGFNPKKKAFQGMLEDDRKQARDNCSSRGNKHGDCYYVRKDTVDAGNSKKKALRTPIIVEDSSEYSVIESKADTSEDITEMFDIPTNQFRAAYDRPAEPALIPVEHIPVQYEEIGITEDMCMFVPVPLQAIVPNPVVMEG